MRCLVMESAELKMFFVQKTNLTTLMKNRFTNLFAIATAFSMITLAGATEVGEKAPDFEAKDVTGKVVKLADLKGKTVVLEWINFGCPFVKKHYGSGNMQKLQGTAADDSVVWITVNSAAEGKQGYLAPDSAEPALSKEKWAGAHYIVDASGVIGKAYGAKVTPHMFVIDKEGVLVYNGAIDDKSTTKAEDVEGATNYVTQALAELAEGKEVSVPTSKPYGCGVKY